MSHHDEWEEYVTASEEIQNLRIENERLRAEIERLKAEKEEFVGENKTLYLYYKDWCQGHSSAG